KPWVWQEGGARWPWIGAAVFAGTGLILPQALRPIYLLWMKIGHALGWINTRIILGLVFFVMFAPIALVLRIFGKDPMHRKLDDDAGSYRVPSEKLPRERMEKPF
ncbi:MAG: SxtJ family membrane protein, partial [Gammaproteobacteria bacterium]